MRAVNFLFPSQHFLPFSFFFWNSSIIGLFFPIWSLGAVVSNQKVSFNILIGKMKTGLFGMELFVDTTLKSAEKFLAFFTWEEIERFGKLLHSMFSKLFEAGLEAGLEARWPCYASRLTLVVKGGLHLYGQRCKPRSSAFKA